MTTASPISADAPTAKRSIVAYHQSRLLMAAALIANFSLFWWVGDALNIPESLYFGPTLAQQAAPILTYLAAGVTLIIATVVGTLIAGRVRADAGFFSACAGMAAWAIRFGTAGAAYRQAGSAAIFLWLAVEMILLAGLLAGAWYVQCWLGQKRLAVDDTKRDGMAQVQFPLIARILALGAHVACTCLLLLALLRSNDKAQALAAIGLASLVGSLVAHSLFSLTPSVWMWSAPIVAGFIGYLIGFAVPGHWMIGQPAWDMTRAIPMDYVSAGPAGALIGYWISRRWHAGRQQETARRKRDRSISAR